MREKIKDNRKRILMVVMMKVSLPIVMEQIQMKQTTVLKGNLVATLEEMSLLEEMSPAEEMSLAATLEEGILVLAPEVLLNLVVIQEEGVTLEEPIIVVTLEEEIQADTLEDVILGEEGEIMEEEMIEL